jgi:hypothetical protein
LKRGVEFARSWQVGRYKRPLHSFDGGTISGRGRLLCVPDHPLIDPHYLRERAVEFRAHAERVQDEGTRRLMLNLAESYEHLARRAEERPTTPESS